MANVIAIKRNTKVFIAVEATKGTPAKAVSDDTVMLSGPGSIVQAREVIPDEQIRAGRSRLTPIPGRYEAGAWNFPTYIKPSGALGTKPEAANLFKVALGTETTNAGVSVVYTLANNIESFSLWFLKDHTLYIGVGATVNVLEMNIPGGGPGLCNWSGQFIKQLYAGTDELNGEHAGASVALGTITVADARKYNLAGESGGIYITIGSDDNGGAGFQVTGVNYTTNVLTISPNLTTTQADEAVVAPWVPTQTELGDPLHGKPGIATLDEGSGAANYLITSFRMTLTNNVKYIDDEKSGDLFPATHLTPSFRDVAGTVEILFRQNDVKFDRFALQRTSGALIVPIGDVAGDIVQASLPQLEFRAPADAGDEEIRRTLDFDGPASSSLNDELSITFV